ncbi:flagellar basal body L-ring protein FlgH [Pseudoduganella sp. GCM10020061]|jgi:flagellar L-ring protein precursor FlgH|uniref:flagellar basal body L-ring protein FlgH n=1 Tax=Pseudoduganella sp. GCM10020061 TaxID=3317345 RepID=UPI0036406D1D
MKTIFILAAALALAACGTTPTSIVQAPTSARPLPPEPQANANGAIYQAATYRPMFEDRRARHIGDIMTIRIVENTTANKAGASSGNKAGSAEFAVPGVMQAKLGSGVSLESDINYTDADRQSASNVFSGTLSVTVTEVLANGNLIVAGEKQVSLNKGVEFIRFSGMVNPDSITNNSVLSTQVADARIEYRTNSRLDRAEMMSMASRFFLSMLPF